MLLINDSGKVDLQTNLENWQDEWKADFAMSLEALRQGWDYAPLQNVLQGEITHFGAWEAEAPYYADDLALIRLKILERQQRYPEYLYLAKAEGQTQRYLTMLARLGRIEEAMQAAQTNMKSMEEAFALAQTLREQEALTQALQIAQRGLTLPGNRLYEVATWTSELAQELGNEEAALGAKVKAFQAKPTFSDYRKIEALAKETWAALKPDLLEHLPTVQGWGTDEAKVNIFLHEGLIDDAIATLNLSYSDSSLIHRVMEAAITERPDWVIENAKRRAEAIMDAKKAEYYDDAIKWLRKARAAYHHMGQKTEWSAYRTQLMTTHARKHKLMGLLKPRDLE